MSTPLREHFDRIRRTLLAKAHELGFAKHSTLKGTARELVVADFLAANLPPAISCASGEIIDTAGTRSPQIDVLLLPSTAPRFQLGGNSTVALAHGVVAALEVKSNLDRKELTQAAKSCHRVKSLAMDPAFAEVAWSADRAGTKVNLSNIPFCIVAFRGPKFERVVQLLTASGIPRESWPNTITVLSHDYTLVRNDGWMCNPQKLENPAWDYVRFSEHGACLGDLFDYLMKCAQSWIYAQPRTPMLAYLEAGATTLPAAPRRKSRAPEA